MNEQIVVLGDLHDNPYQPRQVDDAEHIENLARSIAADGLLQKPTARDMTTDARPGHYELAFGHSRRKAFEWLRENWESQGFLNRYDGYSKMPINVEELTDEQMFRHAVAENVQRKDLDAIEIAQALKKYMDEFGATSKAAGELFGMSDATVRGKVRLLDLPTAAQEKLSSGAISEGTARALLSVQKIASEKDIVETLKQIERNEDQELPEQIIMNAVENLDNVMEMWNDNFRDGKPRSQFHSGGWPLDLKKFPNDLLPDLSVVEAAAAIGILEKDKESYELVKEWMLNGGEDGSKTTEVAWNALEFSGLHQEFIDRLRHLLNPPACSACPSYTKMRGKHYCGVKPCHERKTQAWKKHVIQSASKKLGIAIHQDNDGKYLVLQHYESGHKALFEKRHKDLRLLSKEFLPERGYYSQYGFEGVDDDIFFVVAVGETATKLAAKSSSGAKGTVRVDKDTQRRNKMLIQRKKELLWELTSTLFPMFGGLHKKALLKIGDWHYVARDQRPVDLPDMEDEDDGYNEELLSRLLVWRLIECENDIRFENPDASCVQFANALHAKIAEWGMKPVKGLVKMAEKFDAELQPVAVETEKKK